MRNGNRLVNGGAGRILFAVAVAWMLGESSGQASGEEGGIPSCRRVDKFVEEVRKGGVEAMAIPGAAQIERERGQADLATREKWAWGQAMLDDLGRIWKQGKSASARNAEIVLDFRDWCLGAQGAGNLKLAIASEETAVELLFRGLADGSIPPEEIQRLLARCSANTPTADYWRRTLALEGHPSAEAAKPDEDAAEYLQLAAIFNDLWLNGFDDDDGTKPDDSGWRDERVEDFFASQLMLRVITLSQKNVALEACLEIQRATGGIPADRDDFHRVADANARNILGKQERLTSWMTCNDAWKFWHQAVKASKRRAANAVKTWLLLGSAGGVAVLGAAGVWLGRRKRGRRSREGKRG